MGRMSGRLWLVILHAVPVAHNTRWTYQINRQVCFSKLYHVHSQRSTDASTHVISPTHADGNRSDKVLTAVCLCVCFSARHLKNRCSQITKLDVENVPRWVLEIHLFWGQKAKGQGHESQKRTWLGCLALCTLVSAGDRTRHNVMVPRGRTWIPISFAVVLDLKQRKQKVLNYG